MMNALGTLSKKEGFLGQRMIVVPPDIKRLIQNNLLIKDFHLISIGYYPNAQYHDILRKNGTKEYILLYCTEGEGTVTVGDTKMSLVPNHFIILPPLVFHHYISSLTNPWTIYWAHFKGSNSKLIYDRYSDNIIPSPKPIAFNEDRLRNFMLLLTELENSFSSRSLEFVNINLLYFITSLVYDSDIDQLSLKSNMITESIDFMKLNLKSNLKVNHFARQQNLSVSRYSELFKEKTGFSPIYYYIKLKIQKSCQYLYFTDLSIKEICKEVGFEDAYYFSRTFKNYMGMAPSFYRAEHNKK